MSFFPYNTFCLKRINGNACFASADIFILDILSISFRGNIFSPIILFAASVTIHATYLHFVEAPPPRSLVFYPPPLPATLPPDVLYLGMVVVNFHKFDEICDCHNWEWGWGLKQIMSDCH